MPEHFEDDRMEVRRDETTSPGNPPNSVLRPEVRRTALWTYLGILVVVFMIAGAALLFLITSDRLDDRRITDPSAIGTSGDRMPRENTPGGFDPAPDHDDTADELEFRGAGDEAQDPAVGRQGAATVTTLEAARAANTTGRAIELENIEVAQVDGAVLRVRDGDDTATIISPDGSPAVRPGQHVDVAGTIEGSGQDVRIRATRIDVR